MVDHIGMFSENLIAPQGTPDPPEVPMINFN